jgi:hypothetical protein
MKDRFFDRSTELTETWKIILENYEQSQNKRMLPIACQLYGCGKTMFGERLSFQRPLQDETITSIFDNVRGSSPATKEKFKDAYYIRVDLATFRVSEYLKVCREKKETPDFETFVRYLIWTSFCKRSLGVHYARNNIVQLENEFFSEIHSIDDLAGAIEAIVGGKSLFLHFDELAAIDDWKHFQDTNETILDVYYKFWAELVRYMNNEIFVFTSGKSTNMYLMGKQRASKPSPSYIRSIYLKPFEVTDIKEIIEFHEPELKTNETRFVEVAKWLHGATSGIPRLVDEGIKFLKRRDSLLTIELLATLTDSLLNYFHSQGPTDTVPTAETLKLPEGMMDFFDTMIMYVAREVNVDVEEKIGDFTIGDLINYFSLYAKTAETDKSEGTKLTLICPLLWRKYMDISHSKEILKLQSSRVNKATLLECSISLALLRWLGRKFSVADLLPPLKEWEFGSTMIPPVFFRPVSIRILKSTKNNVFQDYIKDNESSLVTFAEQSASPDMTVLSPLNSTTTLMMGFQAKNYNLGSQHAIGKLVLGNETMKFVKMKELVPNKTEGIFVMVHMGSYTEELKPFIGKVVSADELLGERPEEDGKRNLNGRKWNCQILLLDRELSLSILKEEDRHQLVRYWKEQEILSSKDPERTTDVNKANK